MALDNKVVLASTHTPEYMLHKYWARKPHNIISSFIEELVPENGMVLDPFCGSGVVINEAIKQGKHAVGIDINPVAILNTKVLTNPPQTDKFYEVVSDILDNVEAACGQSFLTDDGKKIKYLVHSVSTKCPNCGKVINCSDIEKNKEKKKYLCPDCETELSFNLESLCDTKVTSFCVEGEKNLLYDREVSVKQQMLSTKKIFAVDESQFNYDFVENRRILAFNGMKTSDLFTERNFNILCHIAEQFNTIADEEIKDAALLLLTASVAQCSRLIPFRNNLSTGGPAWSVPGFWVPAQHLETNPLVHLRARLKKFKKGLDSNKNNNSHFASVIKGNSLEELKKHKHKFDLIFLDPPYGDNVPYTEFSAMWNSFLKEQPNVDLDISVSDRKSRSDSWRDYSYAINSILEECTYSLKKEGHLLITFNNNDLKAWQALLNGLQRNGFTCDYVTYVIPAVVSSKAQFSPKTSYITDIYAVFSYNPEIKPIKTISSVTAALKKMAGIRTEDVAVNLVYRTIMITWLENNIDSELLKNVPAIVKTLFEKPNGGRMHLKENSPLTTSLKVQICEKTKDYLNDGPCDWKILYQKIASDFIDYGFLDASELREYINDNIIISNNNICLAYKEEGA